MNDQPRIYTASYRAARACDPELVVVGISLGKPKWLAASETAWAMPVVRELARYGAFQFVGGERFPIRSVSHAAQLTFSSTPCAKLIENHHGRSWLQLEGQHVLLACDVRPLRPTAACHVRGCLSRPP